MARPRDCNSTLSYQILLSAAVLQKLTENSSSLKSDICIHIPRRPPKDTSKIIFEYKICGKEACAFSRPGEFKRSCCDVVMLCVHVCVYVAHMCSLFCFSWQSSFMGTMYNVLIQFGHLARFKS